MLAPEEDPKAHNRRVGCWCLVSATSPEIKKFKSSFHQLESYFYLEWHLYIVSSWKTEIAALPGSTKSQKKTPNKIQENTAAGAGGEALRRMRQEQLSDQAAAAPALKGAMAAVSKICRHRWWNMFVTLSLDFNKSLKK